MLRTRGRHGLVPALIAAGLVVGVLAEAIRGRPVDPSLVVADLAVGWILIGCGVVAVQRRPGNRIGLLLATTGFAWFVGSVAPALLYLHRGPLVQVLLAFPTGRVHGRLARATVVVAYLDSAIEPVARLAPVTIILAAALVLAAVWSVVRTSGPARRGRAAGATAALGVGGVLVVGSLGRILDLGIDGSVLWVYEILLGTIALGLVVDLLVGGWSQATVTSLVVDLGARRQSGLLRDRLAAALGDPSLTIGYRVGGAQEYIDETGLPVPTPVPGDGRALTPVESNGERIAILVHDEAVLGDPLLIESVAAAARIALTNARLQAEIQDRVAQLAASRRRLVEAADAQRLRLEQELQAGAAGRLSAIEGLLANAAGEASGPLAEAIKAVGAELHGALVELRDFARGVYPSFLAEGGLVIAIRELAVRAPMPVSVDIPDERFPRFVEATGYFVCSEALANVAKHAGASSVAIVATQADGGLHLVIRDDGVGGAELSLGSGLRGLVDRVEAVGGRLSVHSPAGEGTSLLADLPLS